ncbi:tRNA-specific adenosine deaminase 1 [Trichonephila clavata]|uniref:tRNA-specific adenosine deaminase 1 n=1 Tax=Trichonephila clavata TaxID=2740835 RepID=A0A8X6H6K0_TRICU|nr:tRNA-specific adenosine deaminase 1 [Trichonephila clavata]
MDSYSKFSDKVSELCYEKFKTLPKRGKPQINKEWTLLAAVVMEYPTQTLKIVSLTTGTKCLGYSELSDKGDVIFDSHAEVLARRGFIKFMMYHMLSLLQKKDSDVLHFDEMQRNFTLKSGIKFHLFISHVPCGDAAIFPKHSVTKQNQSTEEQHRNDDGESYPKKLKPDLSNDLNIYSEPDSSLCTLSDIHRTGAKCVEGENQDPKVPGKDFHITGVLRTKPGRGDPTWSMSCSDKIALWNICGIQGALLSCFLTYPIYLSSLIFGQCPFDVKALQRAVVERLSSLTFLPPQYHINRPAIFLSSLEFEYSKNKMLKIDPTAAPCPTSIIWCDIPNFLEVSVNGRKQGITKKNINKPTSRISICKILLLEKFLEIRNLLHGNEAELEMGTENSLTYLEYKQMAKSYQEAKLAVWKIFDKWKKKPDHLQNFLPFLNKKE